MLAARSVFVVSSIRADHVFRPVGNLCEIVNLTCFRVVSCEPQKAGEQEGFSCFYGISTIQGNNARKQDHVIL